MSDIQPQFTPSELQDWQQRLDEANRNNVLCHCRECDRDWWHPNSKLVSVAVRASNTLLVGSFLMVVRSEITLQPLTLDLNKGIQVVHQTERELETLKENK